MSKPASWESADSYHYVPPSGHYAALQRAIWLPAPPSGENSAIQPGLVLVETGSPLPPDYPQPYLLGALHDIHEMVQRNPRVGNLLNILGIAVEAKNMPDDKKRFAGTFLSIAALSERFGWINEKLGSENATPKLIPTDGKYNSAAFMEHWQDDAVLMAAGITETPADLQEAATYAAHDSFTHALGLAALTRTIRWIAQTCKMPMGDLDLLLSVVHAGNFRATADEKQRNPAPYFALWPKPSISHEDLTAEPTKRSVILAGQIDRYHALQNLPLSPFPDPRDSLPADLATAW